MRMIYFICDQKKQYSVQGVGLDLDCECQIISKGKRSYIIILTVVCFGRSTVLYIAIISVILLFILKPKEKNIIVEMCSVRLNEKAFQLYSLFLFLLQNK